MENKYLTAARAGIGIDVEEKKRRNLPPGVAVLPQYEGTISARRHSGPLSVYYVCGSAEGAQGAGNMERL